MRIVFMGTPDFALPSLRAVVEAGHEVALVVTQPDRPAGRGHRLVAPPVKRLALQLGLEVAQPETTKTPAFAGRLRQLAPEVNVVVAFGQILTKEVLEAPSRGSINVHASLLPKYRGAAPIQHALLNGETATGISTQWMAEKLDAGDIILQEAAPIALDDTYGTLHDKLAVLGAEVLVRTLRLVEESRAPRIPQSHDEATFARSLKKEQAQIDWSKSARAIVNHVRAFSPRPGAFTTFAGEVLKIWQATVEAFAGEQLAGMVLEARSPDGLLVKAGEGAVLVQEVQPENGRRMSAAEWLRGHRQATGARLGA